MAIISWLDWQTGWELSLFVLYAIPILLVVWFADVRSGIVVAFLSALAWWTANEATNRYTTEWGYPVATLSRLAYFLFVAIGGTAIRRHRDADRERIKALERTRELEKEIVRISEHEQRRIGQDLHDDLCQELAAIGCLATMFRDELAADRMPGAATAGEIAQLISDAVIKTRDLARGIFPVQLEKGGLQVALEELVMNLKRTQSAGISLIASDGIQVEDPLVAMHLYRIAQEALSNAFKHGRAAHVVVSLREDNGGIIMSVTDDGSGFSARRGHEGMGLSIMRYRAGLINANLTIESLPPGGVRVLCSIPKAGAGRKLTCDESGT